MARFGMQSTVRNYGIYFYCTRRGLRGCKLAPQAVKVRQAGYGGKVDKGKERCWRDYDVVNDGSNCCQQDARLLLVA
ncbi:hypothetical protein MGG_17838 [Pyricularia oryzae 70-15]|uniref:Uncharacterized protein n=3 Tax=Pyricularia oryzae TaxID=318829 RepID=G4NIH3_PYRO7|nr:uncharacterized protein MGG_17838 [Pyricularia oryzae 70-15]EHA48033.1 hypothetical protein MGG_17838 [Pyricularia oryzae 70-15]ELQ39835.1 hypothetical protein OOU_Y34scaffold00477g8 [Pyricularia oryzae Y34]